MKIRRYTIAAFLFMTFVGWFVYSFISQDIRSIDFFGVQLPPMPVSLWVVAPMFILYLASLLHMGSCSITKTLELRRYRKDFEKLVEALRAALLGRKSRKYEFKTERYATLGNVINNCTITPHEDFKKSDNVSIQEVLDLLEDIKEGKELDLRKFHLATDNPIVVSNHRNRYHRGQVIAEDVLSKPDRFTKELALEAYVDYVKQASSSQIVRYKQYMSREALVNILQRINAHTNPLDIENTVLIDLIKQIDVTEDDYICGSLVLSHNMLPQKRIDLFERLSGEDEKAMAAYIFTLYDLEVVEEANDLLDSAREDEYLQFRAYKALKEAGKHYSINLFTSKVCS
jgi:hypothetical protein